jgi:hypothetical protein
MIIRCIHSNRQLYYFTLNRLYDTNCKETLFYKLSSCCVERKTSFNYFRQTQLLLVKTKFYNSHVQLMFYSLHVPDDDHMW